MQFDDYQHVVNNAPNMDYRYEKDKQWRAAYPFLGVTGFVFWFSLYEKIPLAAWLSGASLVGMLMLMRYAAKLSGDIIKYGQKLPAKILTWKISNMGVAGKVEVYLPDGQTVTASYKHPPPHTFRKYSNKNYNWPQVGDVVAVYYWEEKPQYTCLIWEQFKKTGE